MFIRSGVLGILMVLILNVLSSTVLAEMSKTSQKKPKEEAVDTRAANNGNAENSIEKASKSKKKMVSPVGFALDLALNFGMGWYEKADKKMHFNRGYVPGGGLHITFLQLNTVRLRLMVGFGHLLYRPKQVSPAFKVSNRLDRLTASLSVEFYKNLFFFNGQLGCGLMMIKTKNELHQFGIVEKSESFGIEPGLLGAIEIGLDLGRRLLRSTRALRFSLHSDWLRRDERDDITAMIQFAVGLGSTFTR